MLYCIHETEMRKTMKKLLALGVVTTFFLVSTQSAFAAEKEYTIKSGDTLSQIVQEHDGSLANMYKIAKVNNIANVHKIYVGQTLTFRDTYEDITVSSNQTSQYQSQVGSSIAQSVQSDQSEQSAQEASTEAPATSSAKEIIAQRESGGSYTAQNGQYVGRYQLTDSYLNGDYSPANQEKVADAYVAQRYGSWEAALSFWNANGWY